MIFFGYFSAITISKPVATKETILGYLNAPRRKLDHKFGESSLGVRQKSDQNPSKVDRIH